VKERAFIAAALLAAACAVAGWQWPIDALERWVNGPGAR
jgi:hypothetical protein